MYIVNIITTIIEHRNTLHIFINLHCWHYLTILTIKHFIEWSTLNGDICINRQNYLSFTVHKIIVKACTMSVFSHSSLHFTFQSQHYAKCMVKSNESPLTALFIYFFYIFLLKMLILPPQQANQKTDDKIQP